MATSLSEIEVLALDCQATAPDPAKGHLLEVGWGAVRPPEADAAVESCLVRLPDGVVLPGRVGRVTGLTEAMLADGVPPEEAWTSVAAAARAVAARGTSEHCPAVIHFSRFEEPYLRWLCDRAGAAPFPLRIVCTHAVVRKLLPALPRRGLRAVAGYFGHAVAETRRAADHVAATAFVWRALVALLEKETHIRTLEELDEWLATPTAERRSGRVYPMSPRKRRRIPDRPGVYRMLRANGDVLYVGKATSLRQRVGSYFQKRSRHAEHILEMLSQARDLELTVTGSAVEAALEETDAIQRLAPPYNKALRRESRSIVFATPALDHISEKPDGEHRLGPLPGGALWAAITHLVRAHDIPPPVAMLVPESHLPREATWRGGVELFRERLGTATPIAWGARLWRERLGTEAIEFELAIQYDAGAERWTPETVADHLDDLVARACHLVRRGHWLCLLSESTLVWDEPGASTIAIAIVGGRCRRSDGVPSPAPAEKSFDARRRSFDAVTYDRMIVLTREIRRLVAGRGEGGNVRLHVGSSVILDAGKLEAMLRWV